MNKNLKQLIPFGIATLLVLLHTFQVLIMSANNENESYSIMDTVQYASFGLIVTLILIITTATTQPTHF